MEVDDEVYQFKIYDAPPYWWQRYRNSYPDHPNLRPVFLGRLKNVIDFSIDEEQNKLSSSATITINAQELQSDTSTIKTLLTTMSKFLTFNNNGQPTGLISDETTISTGSGVKSFADNPMDYGRFVQIESYNNPLKERRIIFYGMVMDWSVDSSSKQITFNLVSLGHLAGEEIAIEMFRRLDSIVAGTPGGVEFARYDLTALNPLVIMYWLINANDYLDFDATGIGGWRNDPNLPNKGIPVNDELNIISTVTMDFDTIESVIEKCMETVPPGWFFRVDYDVEENRFFEDNPSYRASDGYLSPTNRLTPKVRFKKSSDEPDYYLTNGLEVADYNLAFSGEEFYSRIIATTSAVGKRIITNITSPANSNVHITTAQDPGEPKSVRVAVGTIVDNIRTGAERVVDSVVWNIDSEAEDFATINGSGLLLTVPIGDVSTMILQIRRSGVVIAGAFSDIPENAETFMTYRVRATYTGGGSGHNNYLELRYNNNRLFLYTNRFSFSNIQVFVTLNLLDPPEYIKPVKFDTFLNNNVGNYLGGRIKYRDKKRKLLDFNIHRTKMIQAQIAPSHNANSIVQIRGLMRTLAENEYAKANAPVYTGTITVRDTDRRKIEDYKLGDTIGLRNFNDFQDNLVGVIAAKQTMHRRAVLTINYVLRNQVRWLQALENDIRLFNNRR